MCINFARGVGPCEDGRALFSQGETNLSAALRCHRLIFTVLLFPVPAEFQVPHPLLEWLQPDCATACDVACAAALCYSFVLQPEPLLLFLPAPWDCQAKSVSPSSPYRW